MRTDPDGYWSLSPFYGGSGDNISTYSVSGTSVSGSMESPNSFTMEMKREGLDYKIYSLNIGGSWKAKKIE